MLKNSFCFFIIECFIERGGEGIMGEKHTPDKNIFRFKFFENIERKNRIDLLCLP